MIKYIQTNHLASIYSGFNTIHKKGDFPMTHRNLFRRTLAALAAVLVMLSAAVPAFAAGYGTKAGLLMRLATRTGPGTWYDEPGTFFTSNYSSVSVRVLSRSWDNQNDIWWVQVEFSSGGKSYRAYTGLKRVNVNINTVPDEYPMGSATMRYSATAYWGPGTNYASSKYDIPSGVEVTIYDVENGYAQVEFSDSRVSNPRRRAWTPTSSLSGSWGSDTSTGYRSIPGRPDKRQAVVSSAGADSYITSSKDPYAYLPEKMIDGLEPTAWQFSTTRSPLGQCCCYFNFTSAVNIDEIWMKNGFWKITSGYDQYYRNSRVRGLAVSFRYAGSSYYTDEISFTVGDSKTQQIINLGPHRIVTGVRLRILSIYTGEKFPNDVCISEAMFISTPSMYP